MIGKKRKNKFYSLDRIKQKKATYNLIIGERSNGKTYAVLREGLKNYLETGEQLAIVRRWKEDITGRRASAMFASLVSNGEVSKLSKGKYTGIYYRAGRFFICNYDEKGKAEYDENNPLAFSFALSDTEHDKSISFPNVKTIVFDEFLTKHVYLPDEFMLFMNTVSTIVRQRNDVAIYMLGNTVNKFSPYFKEMGLTHINKMAQGTIDVYKYGDSRLTVAVEYCASLESNKKSNHYFAFNNPKLEMITGGSWELGLYPHLPEKYNPNHVLLIYFIIFEGETFQCNVVSKGVKTFTFIHPKTTPIKNPEKSLIYSFEHSPQLNHNRSIFKPINKIQERVLWYYKTDRVFYSDNDTGNTISNYLKEARING